MYDKVLALESVEKLKRTTLPPIFVLDEHERENLIELIAYNQGGSEREAILDRTKRREN
jgi:hypothetical protein